MTPAALALALALASTTAPAPAPKLDPTRHGPDVPGTVEPPPAAPPPAPGTVLVAGVAWHESDLRIDDPSATAPASATASATPDDTYTPATPALPLRVPIALDGRTVRAIETRF